MSTDPDGLRPPAPRGAHRAKAIRKYSASAVVAGMCPGGPSLSAEEWSELAEGRFPTPVDRRLRQSSWPGIQVHRERIKGWLGVVTVATIRQRLVDDHGLEASESLLRRWIAAYFDEEVNRDAVAVLRDGPDHEVTGQTGTCFRCSHRARRPLPVYLVRSPGPHLLPRPYQRSR